MSAPQFQIVLALQRITIHGNEYCAGKWLKVRYIINLAIRLTLGCSISVIPVSALAASCICVACAFDPKLENFRSSSESMAPTFGTKDCALMRYINPDEETVHHGDIVGFVPQPNQPIHVFRVIAISGDTIELRNGVVILNDNPLPQVFLRHDEFEVTADRPLPRCESPVGPSETCRRSVYKETMPNSVSYEILDVGQTRSDEMGPILVPKGHVFVMGDHRDNAADSRIREALGGVGLVPIQNIRGKFEGL